MEDNRRNQMTRKQQEAQCWEEYYASNKTPEEIEAEIEQAWNEYFSSQSWEDESLSELEDFACEGESDDEAHHDTHDTDVHGYSKRKKTAYCHKAIAKKAKAANRNLRKRQEDDAQNHRKVVRKRKKNSEEDDAKPVKSVVRRVARATNSRSGRAVTLINKAEMMGYTVE